MISTLALVATLLVLIFYTIATWSLRNQAIKQTKLSQRPFVTIYGSALSGIKYKNSGLGVALNIESILVKAISNLVDFDEKILQDLKLRIYKALSKGKS